MNCREARNLMDEVLDGNPIHQTRLEAHLAECERCRDQWVMLRRTQEALAECVRRPVEPSALERLTTDVLAEVGAQQTGTPAAAGGRRWVAFAMAASLLLAFATGVGAGRTIWPRAVTVTKVVTQHEVVERSVEVPVPVVKEQVVVKRVPVLTTRVVYRDRPAPREGAAESEILRASREMRRAAPPPEVELIAVHPVVRREFQPAAVIDEGGSESDQSEPMADGGPRIATGPAAQTIMAAQIVSDTPKPIIGGDQ